MLLVGSIEQILLQRACITETLYNAVHVTCVTQVLQAGQAAFLKKIHKKEKEFRNQFPPLLIFQAFSMKLERNVVEQNLKGLKINSD